MKPGQAMMRARRITRAHMRRASGGFTLIELMVVVILVALLATLAVPSLGEARNDRLAFRTADTFARLIHTGHTHALGGSAATIVIITSDSTTDRGTMRVYESVDGSGNGISSCKNVNQWLGATGAGTALNPLLNGESTNLAATSSQVVAGLESTLSVNGTPVKSAVICFTPGGRIYVASDLGLIPTPAINALPTAEPFSGDLIFTIVRRPGGIPTGLTRQVIMTGNGGMRVHSI